MFYEEMSFDNFMDALQNFDFGFLNLMLFATIMGLTIYLVFTAIEIALYNYKIEKQRKNCFIIRVSKVI